jgi:uncharacterized protein YciI
MEPRGRKRAGGSPPPVASRTAVKALVFLTAAALAAPVCAAGAAGPAAAANPYYVVFLRPDPERRPMSVEDRQRIQAAHMANIRKMADAGILVAAGPMEDKPTTISGIFIFKSTSTAEAHRIAALDPTVVEKRNTVDAHAWSGPPGIGEGYFRWTKEHPGGSVDMNIHAFCMLKRGPGWAEGSKASVAHAKYIESLRASGMLAAAGPTEEDPELAGIVVFKTPSVVDANLVLSEDPAVQAGLLTVECHRWWTADRILPW